MSHPSHLVSTITLPEALGLGRKREVVAFTGAGGKTSLMMALARQLSGKKIVTTTTRMFAAQIEAAEYDLPAAICRFPDLEPLNSLDEAPDTAIVVGPLQGDKVTGVPLDLPQQFLSRSDIDAVLVEADGSKMLPIKAPAAHEPALPTGVTLVVPVAGMNALGGRIEEVAHRPNLVAGLLDKQLTDLLTVDDIAFLLSHDKAGLKGVPDTARIVPVINKVDTPGQLSAARQIAKLVLQRSDVQQVVLSSRETTTNIVEVQRRVTAIVLAAGQSQRMGSSKQLLPWGETTVLGQTLRNLKESAVHNILVVTGAEAKEVEFVARAENVPTVFNRNYSTGEMLSSLQTAVGQLSPDTSAVLVVLADQPMVSAAVIDQILKAYWKNLGINVAPKYDDRRGNPVLIDHRYFDELLALPVGTAPRDMIKRHSVMLVDVTTDAVLQDIDSPADYERYRPDM